MKVGDVVRVSKPTSYRGSVPMGTLCLIVPHSPADRALYGLCMVQKGPGKAPELARVITLNAPEWAGLKDQRYAFIPESKLEVVSSGTNLDNLKSDA